MASSSVLIKTDGRGIGSVILNRPRVNNAYNSDMIQGLTEAINELSSNPKIKAIVLRANGRHFQAGADLEWIKQISKLSLKQNIQISENTSKAVLGLNSCPKPTLALVNGGCIGGGTGIAAACDIVLASDDSFFAISEVRWGLHAGPILPLLAGAIGTQNLRRLALSGEYFDAYHAQKIGLVHEVCDTGKLDTTALPILEKILENGPEAMRDTKRIILGLEEDKGDKGLARKLVEEHACKRMSNEAAEGLKIFLENRLEK